MRLNLVRSLLDGGANIEARNSSLQTPMHAVLSIKDEDCAKLFIEYGCSIDALDNHTSTPLMTAVRLNLINSVKLLLSKGANPNYVRIRNFDDWVEKDSVISEAAKYENVPMIRILWENGASLSCREDLQNLLSLSVARGNVVMAKYFLDKGADVNHKEDGETLISVALRYRTSKMRDNVLQILLDHGADIILEDSDGKTALDRAYEGSRRIYREDTNGRCLIRHLALIKSEGRRIGRRNRTILKTNDIYKKYYAVCLNELRLMQTKKIVESNLTFYDVLMKTEDEMVRCLQNERIVDGIKSDEFYKTFPVYCWNFRNKLSRAQERLSLMNKGRKFLREAVDVDLPVEISNYICEFLTNEDLISLGRVCVRAKTAANPFSMSLRGVRKGKYS
ncbi:hypothetical protein QAD02_016589 [Eretmocerus hayati]|uniref:Uncharacterized protein n=1 Tax=Eretmocerus hayati TaxID=131215 RepID=A0ACC2PED2_9HYME|nr:hypothetical protein QAD02_016589 [Eretmocerus hayati]